MLSKEEYAQLIRDALTRNESVVLAGYCTVRYSGRAESFLEYGDRIIMLKSDNTLIVHQPQGNAPINYMKPGSDITVSIDKGNLLVYGRHIHKKEHLWVSIEKVHFFNNAKLEDAQAIVIQGTERDMSDMLYKNPDMVEPGFTPVTQEEQTTYGFIDVFGTDSNGMLTIVECKRTCADLSAVTQLRRYVERMKATKGIDQIRGIIAAPKITQNAQKMLEDWGYSFKAVKPPMYLERFDRSQTKLDTF